MTTDDQTPQNPNENGDNNVQTSQHNPANAAADLGERYNQPEETERTRGGEEVEVEETGVTREEVTTYSHTAPDQNIEVTRPTVGESTEKKSYGEILHILREFHYNISAAIEANTALLGPIFDYEGKLMAAAERAERPVYDDEGNPWARYLLRESMPGVETSDVPGDALKREGSLWQQQIEHEGLKLRSGRPAVNNSGSSDDAVLRRLGNKSGMSVPYDTLLPRSGVWVRFRSPSLSAITQIATEVSMEKARSGFKTRGLVFNGFSQRAVSMLVYFALRHVEKSNIPFNTPADLLSHICQTDINDLLTGLACTIYPKGAEYAHECTANIAECNHIERGRLNVNSLFFMDRHAFSEEQLKHIGKRFEPTTPEQLKVYRDGHKVAKRVVWFDNGIGVELKVPTLKEFDDASIEWMDELERLSAEPFNEPATGGNRRDYIDKLAQATSARQYTHWVEALWEINDETGEEEKLKVSGRVINGVLNDVLSQAEYVNKFEEAVQDFQRDITVSVVAVENYNCTKCGKPAGDTELERFKYLIPIDVVNTFFTLANLKVVR